MKMVFLRRVLEQVTGVAVVLSFVILFSSVAIHQFAKYRPRYVIGPGLELGQEVPRLSAVDYSKARGTMLIASSTKCKQCLRALPFYRQVAHQRDRGLQVIAVFQESEDLVRDYSSDNHLDFATQSSADFAALNISALPTVILLDTTGRVINFWIGESSPEAQESMLRFVSSLTN
jgi:hypothetical protein